MNRAHLLKGKESSNIVDKHIIVYQDGSQGKAWEQLCTIHLNAKPKILNIEYNQVELDSNWDDQS